MNDTIARFGSGQSVLRIEDDQLLKGLGRFTDDLSDDHGYAQHLRLCFVRSPYPHARILSVDTSAALAMPGVAAVYTGADLEAAGVKPVPGTVGFKRADGSPGATAPRRPLAHERVRYVGEAVAVVAAATLQQARDAAEAVLVDYEELPMVVTLEQALASGAPAVCEEAPDNIAAQGCLNRGNLGWCGLGAGTPGLDEGATDEGGLAVGSHRHTVGRTVAETGAAFEGHAGDRSGLRACGMHLHGTRAKPQHRAAKHSTQQQVAGWLHRDSPRRPTGPA